MAVATTGGNQMRATPQVRGGTQTVAKNPALNETNPSYVQTGGGFTYNGLSQDPQDAVHAGTLAQAEQEWAAKYGPKGTSPATKAATPAPAQTTNQLATAAATGDPSAAATQAATQNFAPTAAQLASYQPATFSQFGTLPTVNAATYNSSSYNPTTYNAQNAQAATVDPASAQQYLNQNENLLATANAPTFARQLESNNEQLAGRGIFNSGAAQQSQNDLEASQDAVIANAEQPLVSQAMANQQSDVTQNAGYQQQTGLANQDAQNTARSSNAAAYNAAGQYNAGNQQSANAANADATNLMNQYNANNYLNTTNTDESNYNNYQQYLLNSGLDTGNSLTGAYLNTYAPANSTALSTLGQGATNATNAYGNAQQSTGSGLAGASSAFGNALSSALTPNQGGGYTGPDNNNASYGTGTGNSWG